MRAVIFLCLLSTAHADPGRLGEATMERRVFRHTLVGALRHPAQRITWVLHRGRDSARLEVFCQEGKRAPSKGIRLQGEELDETHWLAPAVVRYAGQRVGKLAWELRAESVLPGDATPCHGSPPVMRLECRMAKVTVRPAGAKLLPGPRDADDDVVGGVWKPATRTTISALRCQRSDDAIPAGGFEEEWPLVFVPATEASPGIEWAHENSDMVVQEGGYRRLAPAR